MSTEERTILAKIFSELGFMRTKIREMLHPDLSEKEDKMDKVHVKAICACGKEITPEEDAKMTEEFEKWKECVDIKNPKEAKSVEPHAKWVIYEYTEGKWIERISCSCGDEHCKEGIKEEAEKPEEPFVCCMKMRRDGSCPYHD